VTDSDALVIGSGAAGAAYPCPNCLSSWAMRVGEVDAAGLQNLGLGGTPSLLALVRITPVVPSSSS
jgi:hypothetical protein